MTFIKLRYKILSIVGRKMTMRDVFEYSNFVFWVKSRELLLMDFLCPFSNGDDNEYEDNSVQKL